MSTLVTWEIDGNNHSHAFWTQYPITVLKLTLYDLCACKNRLENISNQAIAFLQWVSSIIEAISFQRLSKSCRKLWFVFLMEYQEDVWCQVVFFRAWFEYIFQVIFLNLLFSLLKLLLLWLMLQITATFFYAVVSLRALNISNHGWTVYVHGIKIKEYRFSYLCRRR